MLNIHKRAKSLDLWRDLSSTTLMEESDVKNTLLGNPNPKISDLENIIQKLREENQSLKSDNAALELNSITCKMTINPNCFWSDLNADTVLNTTDPGIRSTTNARLLVPIQCQVGESVLQVENRILREKIVKLQYISRIWDRYTAELHILQRENQILKDLRLP
jgi:hypothetical protein